MLMYWMLKKKLSRSVTAASVVMVNWGRGGKEVVKSKRRKKK